MIGTIIGDIVGSRFEYDNIKTKDFELFTDDCHFTDDTVLTVAVAGALLDGGRPSYSQLQKSTRVWLRGLAKKYPTADYGTRFEDWVNSKSDEPTNSYGNGAASRISPVGFVTASREQTITLADTITGVTHNHVHALIGASAVAVSTYYARIGWSKEQIKKHINEYFYQMDFTLDEIRPTYSYSLACWDTVPQALEAFFESTSFEDAIRNAISIGGDSDTIAAITGGVAEAYYGVPQELREKAESYLDERLLRVIHTFENLFER